MEKLLEKLRTVLFTFALVAITFISTGSAFTTVSAGEAKPTKKMNPVVIFETSQGEISIELYPEKAPETVKNFIQYVNDKFYDGTIFHRVIPNFVVQGGGFDSKMSQKKTRTPIKNEADNGLLNKKGSLSMARTNDPHSASSQFFINLKDNDFLDFKSKSAQGWGYAVFAQVTKGMDVVEKMAKTKTGNAGPHRDVPVTPIVVKKAFVK